MQTQTQLIYSQPLPEDLIMALDGNSDSILHFIIGPRSMERAHKYGLTLTLIFGEPNFNSQMTPCQIILKGQPYWITVWLLEYHPNWP